MKKEDRLLKDVPGLIDRLEVRTNKRGYLVYETPDAKICKGKECTECREIKTIGSFPDAPKGREGSFTGGKLAQCYVCRNKAVAERRRAKQATQGNPVREATSITVDQLQTLIMAAVKEYEGTGVKPVINLEFKNIAISIN
ncbi:hypothetical protein [Bacillus paranthracis]|uniref:hypothetical protein n=1 Tax=Bacillus paranthracis TaxID=2026186 RepID=UPI001E4D4EC2|nr:hypothetical protein [Bacillus paranthracis]MCC2502485.1 hypothetical protein [Bacillus paranthracis]MDF9581297.1 hypothetical protein [Bacillus paranthracis]MDG1617509.1 hypothetical protein [Bacillus paranthracis]